MKGYEFWGLGIRTRGLGFAAGINQGLRLRTAGLVCMCAVCALVCGRTRGHFQCDCYIGFSVCTILTARPIINTVPVPQD